MAENNKSAATQNVEVYLERRKSREYVGRLTKLPRQGFEFEYSEPYLLRPNAIPLGPEFPLTKRKFQSKRLFPIFDDRIPSRDNPAYPEYCREAGIDPNEEDPIALLATIGKRGPSSFVFEPPSKFVVNSTEVAQFRKLLGLSIRDFAVAFDLSTASVLKLEKGSAQGSELLERIELYILFPETAIYELEKNKAKLHHSRYQLTLAKLKDRSKSRRSNR